ncbi:MAG TPA: XRE family transcriptional regulator [Acidimicrobiales bacterium]|nr:XRE family transcriptional regulator [Acidimicrobiales bacterium]
MSGEPDIEAVVRTRLRGLRRAVGWSLDDLANLTNLSASTISRIETGKRTIGLDVLVPLARALGVDLDTLLDTHDDTDVVIRPTADHTGGHTSWLLSRATGTITALKMRLEPGGPAPEPRVHPGRDWFFVLSGSVRLTLGDRVVEVRTGEAAEFDTMTPHAIVAVDEPAELVMVFDRDGLHAHVHRDTEPTD